MGVLIVPPVDFEPKHMEISAALQKSSQDYVKSLLSQLNITSKPQHINSGGFMGTDVYTWPQEGDFILGVSFVQKPTLSNPPSLQTVFKQAAWIRHKDCVVLGHIWEGAGEGAMSFPSSSATLHDITARTPQDLTPVRIAFHSATNSAVPLDETFFPLMEEALAQKGLPVHPYSDSLFCKWAPPGASAPLVDTFPERTQQILSFRVQEQRPVASTSSSAVHHATMSAFSWPTVSYEVNMLSGIFGAREDNVASQKEASAWDPAAVRDRVMQALGAIPGGHFAKLSPGVTNISATIIAREGEWVYLDKGKAFGLDVGKRLVGQQKEKLHIIRYAPGFMGKDDVAIAFIRWENVEKPLKVGDTLELDQQ